MIPFAKRSANTEQENKSYFERTSAMKNARHNKIIDIISSTNTVTQADLTDKLRADGFDVTQATVSRDIKELGLIKLPCGNGSSKYTLPATAQGVSSKHISIFSQSVISIACALHTIVIKTLSGMAPAAASAVDNAFGKDMLGCIAGDDTIMVVCESQSAAAVLKDKLEALRSGLL